jgi:hypothetical protein
VRELSGARSKPTILVALPLAVAPHSFAHQAHQTLLAQPLEPQSGSWNAPLGQEHFAPVPLGALTALSLLPPKPADRRNG